MNRIFVAFLKNNVDKNKNPKAGAESLSKQNTLPEKFESH